MRNLLLIFILGVVLISCAPSGVYMAPEFSTVESGARSIIVDKGYDETWSELIRFAGSNFFGIDNFEKASGLITLGYGSNEASYYVTGGRYTLHDDAGRTLFDGDYVDFLTMNSSGRLSGRVNVIVESVAEMSTRITINARYVINSTAGNWIFDTGGYASVNVSNAAKGTSPNRILMPTYNVENGILAALK